MKRLDYIGKHFDWRKPLKYEGCVCCECRAIEGTYWCKKHLPESLQQYYGKEAK